MGTPLVSGRRKKTKAVMITTHPALYAKAPYLKLQSMLRNDCVCTKVSASEMASLIPCPADLTSSGGPHDTPNPAVNTHTTATTATAYPLGIASPPPPPAPSSAPNIHAMATRHASRTPPPTMNSDLLPTLSTATAATAIDARLTTSVTMDPRMAFSLVNPTV
nr:unnamed protein product [Digitaria exilis]